MSDPQQATRKRARIDNDRCINAGPSDCQSHDTTSTRLHNDEAELRAPIFNVSNRLIPEMALIIAGFLAVRDFVNWRLCAKSISIATRNVQIWYHIGYTAQCDRSRSDACIVQTTTSFLKAELFLYTALIIDKHTLDKYRRIFDVNDESSDPEYDTLCDVGCMYVTYTIPTGLTAKQKRNLGKDDYAGCDKGCHGGVCEQDILIIAAFSTTSMPEISLCLDSW